MKEFESNLYPLMSLPEGMHESNILQFTSPNVMNQPQRVILVLYGTDPNADNISIPNVARQCVGLIAKFPTIIAHSYRALAHKLHGEPLVIRPPQAELDIAENFLYMLGTGQQVYSAGGGTARFSIDTPRETRWGK